MLLSISPLPLSPSYFFFPFSPFLLHISFSYLFIYVQTEVSLKSYLFISRLCTHKPRETVQPITPFPFLQPTPSGHVRHWHSSPCCHIASIVPNTVHQMPVPGQELPRGGRSLCGLKPRPTCLLHSSHMTQRAYFWLRSNMKSHRKQRPGSFT